MSLAAPGRGDEAGLSSPDATGRQGASLSRPRRIPWNEVFPARWRCCGNTADTPLNLAHARRAAPRRVLNEKIAWRLLGRFLAPAEDIHWESARRGTAQRSDALMLVLEQLHLMHDGPLLPAYRLQRRIPMSTRSGGRWLRSYEQRGRPTLECRLATAACRATHAGFGSRPRCAIGDDVGRFTDDQLSCVVDATGAPELRVIDQHFDLPRDSFVYRDCRARAVLLNVVVVENAIPVVERHSDPVRSLDQVQRFDVSGCRSAAPSPSRP